MYIGPIEPKEKSTSKRTVFRLWPPPRCLFAFLSLSRQQRGLRTRVLHAQWRVVGDLEDSPQRVKTLYSTCKLYTASILKLIGHQTPSSKTTATPHPYKHEVWHTNPLSRASNTSACEQAALFTGAAVSAETFQKLLHVISWLFLPKL